MPNPAQSPIWVVGLKASRLRLWRHRPASRRCSAVWRMSLTLAPTLLPTLPLTLTLFGRVEDEVSEDEDDASVDAGDEGHLSQGAPGLALTLTLALTPIPSHSP